MEGNMGHWVKGNKFDIKLSFEDYLDITDVLHDDRLSRQGVYRLKSLAEVNAVAMPSMAIFCLPFGYGLARLFTGRSVSGYRYLLTTMSITYPLFCWYGMTRPLPRKLHTDIICDQGEDGSYVRILQSKPGLWKRISQQLHDQGYEFPEIIENSNKTSFPIDFVR